MNSPLLIPKPVIIMMVKAPRPGEVKTRLTPSLTAANAASLASAFLQDTARNARAACTEIMVAFAPADGYHTLAPLLSFPVHWVEQQGADLGARLDGAAGAAEALGFGPIVVIGADSPTLPLPFLNAALSSLQSEEADLTLGPTEDGGYYLVGTRRRVRGLFENVAWSTSFACSQTLSNGQQLGLRPLLLPRWYDIDTFDDLLRLRQEFKDDLRLTSHAPATGAWLQAHDF